MPKQSFEDKYPHIARWVYEHQGGIEIGAVFEWLKECNLAKTLGDRKVIISNPAHTCKIG